MMDIAIFGAGIAGLMAAIALRAQGHRCRIYERMRRDFESGMGFILLPEGISFLQTFGVKLTGEFSGMPLYRYCGRNSAGDLLYDQPLPPGSLSIRRRDLIAALTRALSDDSLPIYGAELAGLDFGDAGKVSSARLNTGATVKADLYISAEGIHSRARQALFPGWPCSPAQVQELVGLVRCAETVCWGGNNLNKFHASGGGIALGTMAVDPEELIWYVQFDAQRFPPPADDPKARHAFAKNLIGDWAEPVPHILEKADFSRAYLWRPLDSDLIPQFHRANLVLIGDAAHPLSPFTSQGVSAAIADAASLAHWLKIEPDLEPALSQYSRERHEQCARYLGRGRELTKSFLSPHFGDTLRLPIAESEPVPASPFADNCVRIDLLRERAFNLRWAQQPQDVIPLTAADPDFPVCPAIQERLIRHVRDGVLSYGPPEGLPQFRQAVAEWMHSTRNMDCEPGEVFATDSAASGMGVVARASLQAGDEVLIPDPVDFLLHHSVQRAGAVPVRVSVDHSTTAEEFITRMEKCRTSRTRMLWLCNPHNPLGVVYGRTWQEKVAEWAIRHGLRMVADEIWSDIVYSPNHHVSTASIAEEIARNTVTIYGFSKNFALAGLRVGCIICNDPEWKKQIVAVSDAESTVYGVSVLSQVAVVAALHEGRQWLSGFVQHLQSQRDYVLDRLAKWPGVMAHQPQGTYVVFPNISRLSGDSELLCERLLNQARVALVPGAPRWFGPGASGHLRICFATSRGILQEAFDRMDPVIMKIAMERPLRNAVGV